MIFDSESLGGYGTSALHRLPAGFKLLFLFLFSIVLFSFPMVWLAVSGLAVISGLYFVAGFSPFTAFYQFRHLLWFIGLFFLFSLYSVGLGGSLVIVLRLVCLFFLAHLVTLTTPLSVMMAAFERFFIVLKPLHLNPARIALLFSLTLRFIPVLGRTVHEVRQAQATRGLERSFVALVVPVVVAMMKMSEDVANAIEARGFDE